MLRRGALLIMLAAPFLFYASYARREDKPILSIISSALALGILVFCLWVLRRASRIKP